MQLKQQRVVLTPVRSYCLQSSGAILPCGISILTHVVQVRYHQHQPTHLAVLTSTTQQPYLSLLDQ
jgi:hypothetical protein